MINWLMIGILFAVALACCAIGFKRFVWFMSVGYGYAVAGIAVATFLHGVGTGTLTALQAVSLAVTAAYGIRLGTFLLKRELGNKNYKKILDAKMGKDPPLFVKIVMWLAMGVIYICETAALHFRMADLAPDDWALGVGIVIMAAGAVIEALADQQKNAQKNARPDMPAMEGLFRLVRCPNYLGEMLFWTGVFFSGVTVYNGIAQWVIAVIGYVAILYIMIDGAIRMEKGHDARYGQKPEYIAYAQNTALVIPFIGKHK